MALKMRQLTHRHLLCEGERDEEKRQPHGQHGDDLVHGELQAHPFVLGLRGVLEQKVREHVLGGDVRDGHGVREQTQQAQQPVSGWILVAGRV